MSTKNLYYNDRKGYGMKKILIVTALLGGTLMLDAQDVLSSWNNGENKRSIINFVHSVSDKTSPDYVIPKDRIAVFDNDGTLWSEQPVYFQFMFAVDSIKAQAKNHPEWRHQEPFKSVLNDDIEGVLKSGKQGIIQIINATHSGMSIEMFQDSVDQWIKTAKHPTKHHLYGEMIFQPMVELIKYLKEHDFKIYVVSGGGVDFMRAFIPRIYGIPKENIIGSSGKAHFQDGKIIKDGGITFIDDNANKPVGIYHHIGKRPIAAFGNSDGDLAMMQYTQANTKYKTFELYVHHTDEKREWKYDKDSHVGKLIQGLDYARKNHWHIVDMKKDWKVIYLFENEHI